NAFTPNDDDVNDVLFVRGLFIDEVYFAVYNRWGEKVFESNALADGWDGTYKGKKVDPDVYGYYLRVKCFNGQDFFKKGNVSVLR
ncbi:MAG TPA: gliding motility-associated C-terminal domain-containing protein, partial [Saprospiraceae bacterium]|nr:gliding motility-associated C-terminal domain-containing protein [Saprospiraceae bacterium]